jgi:hypothetical protein
MITHVATHISCRNTTSTAARRSKNTTQVFANDPPSTTLALASKYRTRCVRDETFVNPKTFTTVLPPGVNVANGGVTPRTSRIGSRSDDEGGERAASPEREYPKPWLVGSVPASPEKHSLSLGGTVSGEGGRLSRSSNASAGGEGNAAPAVLPHAAPAVLPHAAPAVLPLLSRCSHNSRTASPYKKISTPVHHLSINTRWILSRKPSTH